MALPQGNGVFVTGSSAGNTGAGWIDTGDVADPTQLMEAYLANAQGAQAPAHVR